MIIFDPIYKLMNGRNENAAGEMAEFLNPLETLAEQTGAAVIYSHHFAKGLASSKEQLDRASGSGVFARHADGIITITPHEEENAFVVEATLRNLRAPAPFVMRWGYPLMKLADELDPKRLKSKVGAKAKYTVAAVVSCLTDTPIEPLGVLAVPGNYLVTLTAGGRTFTERLTLKMDPRATITPLGLTQQFTLATKIAA